MIVFCCKVKCKTKDHFSKEIERTGNSAFADLF